MIHPPGTSVCMKFHGISFSSCWTISLVDWQRQTTLLLRLKNTVLFTYDDPAIIYAEWNAILSSCNHLRRQPQFLPLRNKLPLIGPPHILPDVFIFFFYLPRLIDMLLPVFLSVCVCASVSVCTWYFVLGPINTEHSFLSALCPRQNNNRMLSKEKPSSLFSPIETLAITSCLSLAD